MSEDRQERKRKEPLSFRFKRADEEARFRARADELGCTTSELARELILMGLDGELAGAERPSAPPNPSATEIRQLVIRAAWATIVALSPDLDEEAAAEFLRGVFGNWE